MSEKTLLQRLDEAGSTGADLSPGDPLAAARIRELEEELEDIVSRAQDI